MKIPDCFLQPSFPSPQHRERMELYDAYEERFGEIDWDDFGVANMTTDQEVKDALRQCLKEGKPMREIRPEWYFPLSPYMKL